MRQKRVPVAPRAAALRKKVPSWQQQQAMQRWVIRGAVLVVVVIVAIVAVGYYATQVRPRLQPAARVDGRVYNMGYLLDVVQNTGVASQPFIARGMLDRLVELVWDNKVLLKGSREFGISVGDEDVAKVLKERNRSDSRAARDLVRGELLSARVYESQFKPKAPASAPQIRARAMLLATQDKVQDAQKRLKAGEKFEDVAKALTELTDLKEKGGEVDWVPRGVVLGGFDDVAFNLKPGEMSQPVFDAKTVKMGGYWLIKVLQKEVEGFRVLRILLGSKEEALKVKGQLDAGADFAALAREVSQNSDTKDQGGDPGRLEEQTQLPQAVLETVRTAELNAVSDPIYDPAVSTEGAYWLIRLVEGPAEREVSARNQDAFARNLYSQWFKGGRETVKFENLLDDARKDWIVEQITPRSGRPGSAPR